MRLSLYTPLWMSKTQKLGANQIRLTVSSRVRRRRGYYSWACRRTHGSKASGLGPVLPSPAASGRWKAECNGWLGRHPWPCRWPIAAPPAPSPCPFVAAQKRQSGENREEGQLWRWNGPTGRARSVARRASPGTGCDRTAARADCGAGEDVTVPLSGSYSLEDGTGRPARGRKLLLVVVVIDPSWARAG
jgi:hypothetical protein